MKAVLMSIKPKWCEKIFSGEKTVEVRKTAPKLELPFKVYVYETLGKHKSCRKCGKTNCPFVWCYEGAGAVVGEFVCDWVIEYSYQVIACAKFEVNGAYVEEAKRYNAGACLSEEEMYEYSNGKPLYGLHITAPKRYDTPKELWEFTPWCEKSRNTDDNLEMCCNCKNAFFDEDGAFFGCGVTRPPQSWMYVEELC